LDTLVAVRGGLGRLAAWHLLDGPVGPPARWATTSNVEVGQTTYPVYRGTWEGYEGRGEKRARDTSQKGEGRRQLNPGGGSEAFS